MSSIQVIIITHERGLFILEDVIQNKELNNYLSFPWINAFGDINTMKKQHEEIIL
jgi:hypothetical protein